MWPTEWFNGVSKFKFEGIEVNLPIEYDKYLKQIYGDYMVLPPESKRIAHHYCDVVDFERPYTYYVKKGQKKHESYSSCWWAWNAYCKLN